MASQTDSDIAILQQVGINFFALKSGFHLKVEGLEFSLTNQVIFSLSNLSRSDIDPKKKGKVNYQLVNEWLGLLCGYESGLLMNIGNFKKRVDNIYRKIGNWQKKVDTYKETMKSFLADRFHYFVERKQLEVQSLKRKLDETEKEKDEAVRQTTEELEVTQMALQLAQMEKDEAVRQTTEELEVTQMGLQLAQMEKEAAEHNMAKIVVKYRQLKVIKSNYRKNLAIQRKVRDERTTSLRKRRKDNQKLKLQTITYKKRLTDASLKSAKRYDHTKRLVEKVTASTSHVAEKNDEVRDLKTALFIQKRKVRIFEDRSLRYAEELKELKEEKEKLVETKDGKEYTKEVRMLVYKMLDNGVPFERIAQIIRDVSHHLHGCSVGALPNASSIHRMNVERLGLAHQQVAECLTQKPNLTITSDETSKGGGKFMSFQVHDENERCLYLGLHEISSKSANDAMKTLLDILSDIENASDEENVSDQIIINIKNTMSDRAATCKKFNDILEAYRTDVLENMTGNWETFTDEQKESLTKMYNFFCGLHTLTNAADATSAVMERAEREECAVLEKDHFGQDAFDSYGSSAVRLVRNMSKVTVCGADMKNGAFRQFQAFLAKENYRGPTLENFLGNRFNILFFNGGIAYGLADLVIKFLESHNTNRLTQSLLADCKEPFLRAELKVLGLVNKNITGPMWRLMESETHILDMKNFYCVLQDYLDKQSENPEGFVTGTEFPFAEELVEKDDTFANLVEPNEEIDLLVWNVSKHVLTGLAVYYRRTLADQLPGGKYFGLDEDEEARMETASVPKTNRECESGFGLFDHLRKKRANALTVSDTAHLVGIKNKTSKWLDEKKEESSAECDRLINRAAWQRIA